MSDWSPLAMIRKQNDVEAGLRRKGFVEGDSHHRYFTYYTQDGRKTRIKTKTSHGGRDLDDYLVAQMAKQCGLTKGDFLRLVDCPMDRGTYEATAAARF